MPFLQQITNEQAQNLLLRGFGLINNFIAVDGKIIYYANQEGYKEYLHLMRSWLEKQYLGVDFVTMKNAAIRKRFAAGDVGCITIAISNVYADSQAAGIAMAKIPYLRKTEDTIIHTFPEGLDINGGTAGVITTRCDEKLLPAALAFLNYAYSEDGIVFTNWGPEGLSWNWNEDHTERVYTDAVLNNPDYTTSVTHHTCRLFYLPNAELSDLRCNPNAMKDEAIARLRMLYKDVPYLLNDYLIPKAVNMMLSVDEASERDGIMVDVGSYVKECAYKFVQGTMDIDADWDSYCSYLEHYNLSRAIEIEQAAYDRYQERLASLAQ